MEYYTHSDLTEIVERTADILDGNHHEVASELALRSRGTSPLIVSSSAVRTSPIMGDGLIDDVITDKAFDHAGCRP